LTDVEVWGQTEATKVHVTTLYGSDANNESQLTEQPTEDDLICGAFGTQAAQNWCRSRIVASVATNSSSSETVVVAVDQGNTTFLT